MTWLILGGSGQLGIALSEELGQKGIIFKAWGSQELDITKAPIVRDVIAALSPSVIINCAAWTDVDGAESHEEMAFLVNSQGVENIATAAKACGAKFIQISTDYVFSGRSEQPWKESDSKQPVSVYGRSKASGEDKAIDMYGEGTYIIRTAWLYSPWGKNFAKTMSQKALRDEPVKVVNDQFGQPTSANELARSLVELTLSTAKPGIYHATNSGEASWFDFAQEIYRLLGKNVSLVESVGSDNYIGPAQRPSNSVLSNQNWIEAGLTPMANWKSALAEVMPSIILETNEA
jgi:dTDP-4-dehydrorhamnose reductase